MDGSALLIMPKAGHNMGRDGGDPPDITADAQLLPTCPKGPRVLRTRVIPVELVLACAKRGGGIHFSKD
jgi:hypothetical protein